MTDCIWGHNPDPHKRIFTIISVFWGHILAPSQKQNPHNLSSKFKPHPPLLNCRPGKLVSRTPGLGRTLSFRSINVRLHGLGRSPADINLYLIFSQRLRRRRYPDGKQRQDVGKHRRNPFVNEEPFCAKKGVRTLNKVRINEKTKEEISYLLAPRPGSTELETGPN